MAQLALKIAANVDGDFYVDSTCIDCDACRQIAPTVFHDVGDQSAVFHQPENAGELLAAQKALIERQPSGRDPIEIEPDLLMIPTPGHTRGHAVFLYRNRFLFTGDHLAWNEETNHLYAFRSVCWYSWPEQTQSMLRLLDFTFEWV